MKTKVAVAMSGGVDSGVAAYLLKEKGYEVIGLTMQIAPFKEEKSDGPPTCCGLSDIADARKVAHYLGIRHYVVNFKDIFRKYIINNFIKEYSSGCTPNPCIRCNRYIKFDYLLQRAKEIGAKYLATGHYARITFDKSTGNPRCQKFSCGGKFFLRKGIDKSKDQSYVLYSLNQTNLRQILMPLGGLTKKEVREIAKSEVLPVASKLESQDICFVTDGYRRFLEREAPFIDHPGYIVNSRGDIMGRHKGIFSFTIGQRQGLGISSPRPLYVLRLDSQKNEVVVGEREEGYSREFIVDEVNIISGDEVKKEKEAMVKVRYRHDPAPARIIPLNGCLKIMFKEPQWGITPGQSAVFYDSDDVLGGGIIKN